MRAFLKILLVLVVLALAVLAGGYLWAGRQPGPTITVKQPEKFVGQGGSIEVTIEAPGGRFTGVEAVAEQNGKRLPVFALADPTSAQVTQETADRLFIIRPFGKRALPELRPGPMTLTVTAARPVFFGLRQARTRVTRDLQVRLEPPRLSVESLHHYVNLGGAEFVVYRATPADVESGVRVGDVTYPGYPIAGASGPSDPALKVAFFALLYEQDLNTPITVYAKDAAGNQAVQSFADKVFPKPFAKSRIELTDAFLSRVVPAIAASSPQVQVSTATPEDVLKGFLAINGELRRIDADIIQGLASRTSPQMLWRAPFRQMANSQVEATFADQRTYVYQGNEVDRQVHLGLDLARTARVEIQAANRGTVIYASDLGIYGNCVVIDHGMGVQSLYGHLSSIDVKVGATVEKDQPIGHSGQTGLAGGDHLHFTMLVNGHPVNPVEWWDPHWVQDRIMRKLKDAGAGVEAAGAATVATAEPARPAGRRARPTAGRLHRRGA